MMPARTISRIMSAPFQPESSGLTGFRNLSCFFLRNAIRRGGFRYKSDSYQVGSLLLGLYNSQGRLDHAGSPPPF
jgi:hypothetical protein